VNKPVLWLLAGPNGAGKTTFYRWQLAPRFPSLPFVNADQIAAEHWPEGDPEQAYKASRLAQEERERLLAGRRSFITETVFSHPSKLELIEQAKKAGYQIILVYVHVPIEVSVARVAYRVSEGGHAVPEEKIRARHARLGALVAEGLRKADRGFIFYNGDVSHDPQGAHGARSHVPIASVAGGRPTWLVDPVPAWARALFMPATEPRAVAPAGSSADES
jgi:predicted ABC-type ATPase